MSNKLYLILVLGLWLVVWRLEQCSASPMPVAFFNLAAGPSGGSSGGGGNQDPEDDPRALDNLLMRNDKCTADFFAKFERLAGRIGGNDYDSFEMDPSDGNYYDRLREKLLAECKAKLVDDFASRVAGLSSDERKLAKLGHVMDTTGKHSSMFNNLGGDGQKSYAALSVMGDHGLFAAGARLEEEQFNERYNSLVKKPCVSLRKKLGPLAGFFRLYSEENERHLLKGVDDTFFSLASAANACKELSGRLRGGYQAYEVLLKNQQLPGDAIADANRMRFEGRLKAVVAKANDDSGNGDRCNLGFFNQIDLVLKDASKNGMSSIKRQELEVARRMRFNECKEKFEQELRASIHAVNPALAASMANLGETFYRGQMITGKVSPEKAGQNILTFLKEADPSIRNKKLDVEEGEFTQAYHRLVVDPCKLLNSQLEPAVIIFRRYMYVFPEQHLVGEHNTDSTLTSWIATSAVCQGSHAYLSFAMEAYKNMAVQRSSRFGGLFGRGN